MYRTGRLSVAVKSKIKNSIVQTAVHPCYYCKIFFLHEDTKSKCYTLASTLFCYFVCQLVLEEEIIHDLSVCRFATLGMLDGDIGALARWLGQSPKQTSR